VTTLDVPGYKAAKNDDLNVEWSGVMPGYLETIGARLIAGRDITAADRKGAAPVAVVSQSAAVRYFGSPQNALGRNIKSEKEPRTVVGVFSEIRHVDLRQPIRARVLHPYMQDDPHRLTFVVRTAVAPEPMMQTVRAAMQQLESKLAIDVVITMDLQLDTSMTQERTLALLASAFGLLAALMSAVGLYGVLAFDTVQRTREIGVRMALGASTGDILSMILGEGTLLAAAGIVVGVGLAYGAGRGLQALLAGVAPGDAGTFGAAIGLCLFMTLVGSFIPAMRAVRIDPVSAIRTE
jgi:putative ABC transport system permease protein